MKTMETDSIKAIYDSKAKSWVYYCKKCNSILDVKTTHAETMFDKNKEFEFFVCPKKCSNAKEIYLDLAEIYLRQYIKENWSIIRKSLKTLPKYDEDDELPYLYFDWDFISQSWRFTDVCMSDYYPHGVTESEYPINFMVDRKTTMKSILDTISYEIELHAFIPENLEVILLGN